MGHQQKIEVVVELAGEGWMAVRYQMEDSKEIFMEMLLRSNSQK